MSLISLFLGGGLVAWGYSQGGLTDLQNQTKSEQDYVKKEVKDFNKIDIKSSSYNVLIKNGDVDKATLSYYQKTKNPIDTSVKDGQLTINDNNSELDSTSNKHINFFGLKDLVRLSTLNKEVRNKTIVITLPKKQTIDFLKVDFSTIPILLALVLLDLKSSFVVILIRSVLKLVLNGRGAETLVGLPINIIGVLVFVLAFAVIWNKKKNTGRFVIASLVGTVGLTISMLLVNYYYAIPLYAKFVGFDIAKMVGVEKYLLSMVVPFNLIEGLIWAVTFWMVYTVVQPILKIYEK